MIFKRKKWAGATTFASAFTLTLATSFAVADDLDIYVKDSSNTSNSSNNILLLVDTSGSLVQNAKDGTGTTRKEYLDQALKVVLAEMPDDTNVGLGRYNGKGGSIVYPVSKLSDPSVSSRYPAIEEGNNDAYEDYSNGEVTSGSDKLKMRSGVAVTAAIVNATGNDVEVCGDGQDYDVNGALHAGYDSITCGAGSGTGVHEYNMMKFENLNIPQGATILSANIRFTYIENSFGDAEIEFFAEDSVDPKTPTGLSGKNDSDNFGRNFVLDEFGGVDYVKWTPVSAGFAESKVNSPSIARLVQKIVDNPSWAAGSGDILVGFRDVIGANFARTAFYSYDQNPTKAPILSISYFDDSGSFNIPNQVGLRFPNITVPSGVNVAEGYLILTNADATLSNSVTRRMQVRAESSADSSVYSEVKNDISSRSTFTVYDEGTFSGPIAPDAELVIDIKNVLNNRLNTSNWDGDGDLTFKLSTSDFSEIYSSEAGFDKSPKLFLSYNTVDPDGITSAMLSKRIVESEGDGVEFISCDDACRYSNGGNNVNLATSTTKLSSDRWAGFTFKDVQLPRKTGDNVIIEEAYIQLTSDNDYKGSAGGVLYGYQRSELDTFRDEDNYLTAGDGFNQNVYAGIPFTIKKWAKDQKYSTVDISNLIEDMISESYWDNGDSLSFRLTGDSVTDHSFYSFDGSAGNAPKLFIKYKVENSDGYVTVRQALLDMVDELPTSGGTAFEGSLWESLRYFSSLPIEFGNEREPGANSQYLRISHPGTYTGGSYVVPAGCDLFNLGSSACSSEYISGSPRYVSPMEESTCETNSIIYISDADPGGTKPSSTKLDDGRLFSEHIEELTGKACDGHEDCSQVIVEHMATKDLLPSVSGIQTVNTHLVAFGFDGVSDFMTETARLGNGLYKNATNADELVSVVNEIIASIFDVTTTIVTPGVAVNNNNRYQHLNELYYSVFRPSKSTFWEGNLKKYIFERIDVDNPDSDFVIKDQNGLTAVTSDGLFVADSQSFWSSVIDGHDAKIGGAASQMIGSRPLYTYTGSNANPKEVTLAGGHELEDANTSLTNTMLGIDGLSASEISAIRTYAGGGDVKDADGDNDKTDARRLMGAGLHSRPLVTSYGDSDTVFTTTNEGFLHAFDTKTGKELFSFMPPEFLPKIKEDFFDGNGELSYGWDSSLIALRRDADADGVITAGTDDFVYVYGGFRRGGNKYYALDVTGAKTGGSNSANKLLFALGPDTSSDFSNMGQTWSVPIIVKMDVNGEIRRLLVFGGGYDTKYDDPLLPMSEGTYKGSSIYFVDALTGDLVWQASHTGISSDYTSADMVHSFVSSPVAVDKTGNGVADSIYISDIAGQIFRLDLSSGEATFNDSIDVKLIAQLGVGGSDADTNANYRKFYEPPAVAFMRDGGTDFVAVFAGSGYRANPLDETTNEEMYLIKDYEVVNSDLSYQISSPYTKSDLVDVTDVLTESTAEELVRNADGWYLRLGQTSERKGEKVIGTPVIFNGQVIATVYTPQVNSSDCAAVPGNSTVMRLKILSGGAASTTEDSFDAKDRYSGDSTIGLTSGAKILYTNGGSDVISIINTSIESLGSVGALGLKRKSWRRLRGEELDRVVEDVEAIKQN